MPKTATQPLRKADKEGIMLQDRSKPEEIVVIPGNDSGEIDFGRQPADGVDPALRHEIVRNTRNCRVGSCLVSESDRVRIWHIWMQPGDRLEFHRHVLDYFWTTTAPGRGRSRYADGHVVEAGYALGDTRNYRIEAGGTFMHDLENIGDTVLGFVTVEFLQSANEPLPVPSTLGT